jgi:hypothetical protein
MFSWSFENKSYERKNLIKMIRRLFDNEEVFLGFLHLGVSKSFKINLGKD